MLPEEQIHRASAAAPEHTAVAVVVAAFSVVAVAAFADAADVPLAAGIPVAAILAAAKYWLM